MLSVEELKDKKVVELKRICKENGFKTTGKKSQLIEFILNEVKSRDRKVKKASPQKPDYKKKKVNSSVIEVTINEHSNYEYDGLVFNLDKRVHGVQLSDGKVRALNPTDIDKCKKLHFTYVLPNNLGIIDYKEEDESNTVEFLTDVCKRLNIENVEDNKNDSKDTEIGETD